MKLDELLDMTLRDVLENYCVVRSLECDWVYGVTTWELAEKIYNKYELSDDPSVFFESLVPVDVSMEFDDDGELLSYTKLESIVENNGIAEREQHEC